METQQTRWRPTRLEVENVVAELRPLISQLARRDQELIAAEVLRRRHRRAAG